MGLTSRLPEITAALHPAVHAATMHGAEHVAEGARERVPVVTGRLHDAIHVEEVPEGAAVIAGDNDAFYGNMVEHGGAINRPPHPFLIPALEANRERIAHEVAAAIRQASE
jgi:HK97 gp10 family phage protein